MADPGPRQPTRPGPPPGPPAWLKGSGTRAQPPQTPKEYPIYIGIGTLVLIVLIVLLVLFLRRR